MKHVWFIITSAISAFMATLCCLPALLFLLFGTSFSFLSWTSAFYEYRTFFSILSVIFFVASAFFVFYKPKSCALNYAKKKWIFIYVLLGILIVFMLVYPELLGDFYE
ncbi:aryl sulfotransferase [Campylobacter sp. RM13119]|uniref:aryl sulfotransferase n=1 Tax=Campylobacter TaxID=194 RepID=UPI0014749DAF|nr:MULTISPECIES: aryl sulfotransferase [unclassified Campylobacter]MBE3022295.1 aryl sulfotransferase [Campylobacter sp. 7477a]MBE3605876.1 aryl sulfotransferase [Campylobacter sp. RM13119]MBE3609993.1 aryl sulfotransferase [Campylobacter sp. RM12916]